MKRSPKYFIAVSRKEYLRRMMAKFKRSKAMEKPPKPVQPPPDHKWNGDTCIHCGATGGPGSWDSFNECVRPKSDAASPE